MRKILGTRRRKVFAALGTFALVAGSAAAAFLIYTGASGTTSGSIETASTNTAFVISNSGPPAVIPANGSVNAQVNFQDMDNSSTNHTLSTINGTFSSSVPGCAAHLSYQWIGGSPAGSLQLASGASATWGITYSSDATLPGNCSAASWQIDWTGTTTP